MPFLSKLPKTNNADQSTARSTTMAPTPAIIPTLPPPAGDGDGDGSDAPPTPAPALAGDVDDGNGGSDGDDNATPLEVENKLPIKRRACAECHRQKIKCVYSGEHTANNEEQAEDELKCDRCIRLEKECIRHASRQGQRKTGDSKNYHLLENIKIAYENANAAASDGSDDGDDDGDDDDNDDGDDNDDDDDNMSTGSIGSASVQVEDEDDADDDNAEDADDKDEDYDAEADADDNSAAGEEDQDQEPSGEEETLLKLEEGGLKVPVIGDAKDDDAGDNDSGKATAAEKNNTSEAVTISDLKKQEEAKNEIIAKAKAGAYSKVKNDATKNIAPPPEEKETEKEKEQLPPPSWPDVTYDQLIKYPKQLLRAPFYFDIQQIRAIKPVTLAAMGISVPDFPQLEDNEIIRMAISKSCKTQLYHPVDVLPQKPKAKPFLQKEILRRAILRNMVLLPEDSCHNDLPQFVLQRKKEGKRNPGLPTTLPRPGYYGTKNCIEWLTNNPPPLEEREFILSSVTQWMQQVRDQIGKIEPKGGRSKEVEEALAKFDAEKEKVEAAKKAKEEAEEGGKTKEEGAAAVGGTPAGKPKDDTVKGQLALAFSNYQSQVSPPHVMNYGNMQPMFSQPNMSAFSNQQLAASVSMNTLQANAIGHYQSQLAAMQMQLAAGGMSSPSNVVMTQFEINVSKDTFKFNASHFVAFQGFRERLHGHSYRASIKLIGCHQIGRDGYVLDFGCVKTAAKDACKELNEYFIVPMLSDVLKITVEEDADDGNTGKVVCGPCDDGATKYKKRKRKAGSLKFPGSVMLESEDGSVFIFPRQDCLLLPIMHSTAEEMAIYLYGTILGRLDADYLRLRGVMAMEVTVSEAVGQDAMFRRAIPGPGENNAFDVMKYVTSNSIPVMPCGTDTEAAAKRKKKKS